MSGNSGAHIRPVPVPRSFPQTWVAAAVCLLISLVLLAPILRTAPGARSGLFLSIGTEVLQGKVPYRDLWSQQAPLIFYIDALGLAAGGRGQWGVWLFEWLALSAAAVFLFLFLRRFFGKLPAAFATAGMLANLVFVWEGGLPETYGLLLQAAFLWLLGKWAAGSFIRRRALVVLGVLGGILVLLQVSLAVAVVTAGAVALLIKLWERKPARFLVDFSWVAIGIAAVLGLNAAILVVNHTLLNMLDQVIRFNLPHSGGELLQRLSAPFGVLNNLMLLSGFFCLGAVTWLVIVPYLISEDARFRSLALGRVSGGVLALIGMGILFNGLYNDATHGLYALNQLSAYRLGMAAAGAMVSLVGVLTFFGVLRRALVAGLSWLSPADCSPVALPLAAALIDLPVEIGLWAVFNGGGAFSPVPLIPGMSITIAFLMWALFPTQPAELSGADQNRVTAVHSPVSLLPLALTAVFVFGFALVPVLAPSQSPDAQQIDSAVAFFKIRALPTDSILQWGENGRLYFLSGRSPSSRFIEQTPLFAQGYTTPAAVEGYLADLRSASPVWIIDTRSKKQPLLTMDNPSRCADLELEATTRTMLLQAAGPRGATEDIPYVPAAMGKVYRWFCENYQPASLVGDQQWIVYHKR